MSSRGLKCQVSLTWSPSRYPADGIGDIWRMYASWGMLPAHIMKRVRAIPIAPGKMGAWVCLVALVLLWMPLWATAWQSEGMACCDGKMCAGHGHAAGQRTSGNADVTQESTPINCGHGKQAGLLACGMKCCQEAESTFVAAVIFVMHEQAKITAPAVAREVREQGQAVATPFVMQPPFP